MIRFFCLFLLCLSGCQKTPPVLQQQSLRVNIGSDPQTLDPRKARDLTAITLIRMFFEGLTRHGKSGALEMALAKDVEISKDGTEYTFHLRKSFWSNGVELTSFDFAESWKMILSPQFPTDIAYQLYVIKNARKAKLGEVDIQQVGIQTPDAHTLVVVLEQPIPYFLQLVSMTSFFPIPHETIKENPNWALQPEGYVCNGPFIPKSWKHCDQMRVVKNVQYWQSQDVGLRELDLFMMSSDTELRMFEEGKLDWAGSPLSTIPADAVCELKRSEKFHASPFSATYFFRVNTAEKVKDKINVLSNAQFRKALSYCLNRKEITEHILQGGQTPAKGLTPPTMGLSDEGYFSDANPMLARSLLENALLELDLKKENLEPIKLSYKSDERNAAIAQAIQKQWETALQLRVELDAIEPKTFFQRISQKEFQLAAGSWTADFDDPINFLEVFKYKDASTNNTNWESAKYVELLNSSALCRNLEERKKLLCEAEQILMEQMPIIPVFHYALNYLQCEGLEEVALSPLGQIDFRWAHLEDCKEIK